MDRSFLESLCDEAHPPIASPFSAQIDGVWWDCATTGHAIVMLANGGGLRTANTPDMPEMLSHVPAPKYRVAWVDLLSWLREAGEHEVACPTCKGGSFTEIECSSCSGQGWRDCERCLDSHECGCCEGAGARPCSCEDGIVVARPSTESVLGSTFVDRVLAFRFLRNLQARDVLVGVGDELDPILFRDAAGTWQAVVMPIRSTYGWDRIVGWLPWGIVERLEAA